LPSGSSGKKVFTGTGEVKQVREKRVQKGRNGENQKKEPNYVNPCEERLLTYI